MFSLIAGHYQLTISVVILCFREMNLSFFFLTLIKKLNHNWNNRSYARYVIHIIKKSSSSSFFLGLNWIIWTYARGIQRCFSVYPCQKQIHDSQRQQVKKRASHKYIISYHHDPKNPNILAIVCINWLPKPFNYLKHYVELRLLFFCYCRL